MRIVGRFFDGRRVYVEPIDFAPQVVRLEVSVGFRRDPRIAVAEDSLQAATRLGANDREGLERMARYLSRPPIATDRLSELEDGRLELRLKRPWRDGTTAFRFTPHELIERIVAQVPRPRAHLTRYHGVLAPAFAARSQIVPGGNEADAIRDPKPADAKDAKKTRRPGRFPWASLIWRVFRNPSTRGVVTGVALVSQPDGSAGKTFAAPRKGLGGSRTARSG